MRFIWQEQNIFNWIPHKKLFTSKHISVSFPMIDNVTKVTSSRFIIFSLFIHHNVTKLQFSMMRLNWSIVVSMLVVFVSLRLRDGLVNIIKWILLKTLKRYLLLEIQEWTFSVFYLLFNHDKRRETTRTSEQKIEFLELSRKSVQRKNDVDPGVLEGGINWL